MYNQELLIAIIKKIQNGYSLNELARLAKVDAGYLSRIINKRRTAPPSPKILEKIAKVSRGITSYEELMLICGYIKQPTSAVYDFSSDNDKLIIDTLINYAILNNLSPNSLETNNLISEKLSCLEKINKKQALQLIENEITKFKIIYGQGSNEKNQQSFYSIPVYGQISAGLPNWAEECLEGYLPIDPNMMNIISPEECFFLRINGDSMNKVIRNGAYALIRKQDIVENGEIAAILVNGDSATIKKFTQHGDVIVLEPMSDNPSYQTQIYDKSTSIKILGKYIGKFEINN